MTLPEIAKITWETMDPDTRLLLMLHSSLLIGESYEDGLRAIEGKQVPKAWEKLFIFE